jgi:protease I
VQEQTFPLAVLEQKTSSARPAAGRARLAGRTPEAHLPDSQIKEAEPMSEDRIACILSEGFEDSEFRVPYDTLKKAGFQVDVIGAKPGTELAGKGGKEKVKTEKGIDAVKADQYQALLIPGGYSPDHLRADSRFVDFVAAFEKSKKLIAAVCHGPQILMTAGLVKGRTLTAWSTIQGDLKLAGANVRDEAVVRDGNWVTSRKPEDLSQFSDAIVKSLR